MIVAFRPFVCNRVITRTMSSQTRCCNHLWDYEKRYYNDQKEKYKLQSKISIASAIIITTATFYFSDPIPCTAILACVTFPLIVYGIETACVVDELNVRLKKAEYCKCTSY